MVTSDNAGGASSTGEGSGDSGSSGEPAAGGSTAIEPAEDPRCPLPGTGSAVATLSQVDEAPLDSFDVSYADGTLTAVEGMSCTFVENDTDYRTDTQVTCRDVYECGGCEFVVEYLVVLGDEGWFVSVGTPSAETAGTCVDFRGHFCELQDRRWRRAASPCRLRVRR